MSRGPYLQRCAKCPAAFFTSGGLYEHDAEAHRPAPAARAKWVQPKTPAQMSAWNRTGLRVAALNNSRKRHCGGCEAVSTPAGLGVHQKATGHKGWVAA